MRTALPIAQAQGADAAVIAAVADALGVRPFIYYASFKRRLIMMQKGEIDLMCGLLKGAEREKFIYFINPPYKTRSDTVFFMSKDKQGQLTCYEDLKHLAIGVTRGTKYFPRFDSDPALDKKVASQVILNFRKLLRNRLDVVAVNESLGLDLVNQFNLSDLVGMAQFRFSQAKSVYFGISRKSWMMQDLDRIGSVLNQMISSGRILAIITQYYHRLNLPVPAM